MHAASICHQSFFSEGRRMHAEIDGYCQLRLSQEPSSVLAKPPRLPNVDKGKCLAHSSFQHAAHRGWAGCTRAPLNECSNREVLLVAAPQARHVQTEKSTGAPACRAECSECRVFCNLFQVDSLCGARGESGESDAARRIKTEFLAQSLGSGCGSGPFHGHTYRPS